MDLMKRIDCVKIKAQSFVRNNQKWTNEKIIALHQELNKITDHKDFYLLDDRVKRDIKYLKSGVTNFMSQKSSVTSS